MTTKERRILEVIAALGGEAGTNQIWQGLVERSWFGDTYWGHLFTTGPWPELNRLEQQGLLTSRWGKAGCTLAFRYYKLVDVTNRL